MEKKEMAVTVKTEDAIGSCSSFPLFSTVSDFSEVEKSSLGFIELLGVQDCSALLDLPPQLASTMSMSVAHHPSGADLKFPSDTGKEFDSEVLNQQQPTTPNSSSISSASSEALNDEHNKTIDDQADEQQKTKKLLKPKKANQKRQKEPRFAFMTKSEVDHLEDGYRWRKYGQKAVKNSPFPRSYYRCTNASCNVKKRVERSFTDPSVVVTTYEGQHTHPSPVMSRSGLVGSPLPSGGVSGGCATIFGSSVMPGNYLSQYHHQKNHHQHRHRPQEVIVSTLSSLGFPLNDSSSSSKNYAYPGRTAFLRDHGLLQDVVPSHMLKEE